MFRTLSLSSLALAGALCLAGPGLAEVRVRAPFLRVSAGAPVVNVQVPFVQVSVQNPVAPPFVAPQPQPGPILVQPVPQIVPVPTPTLQAMGLSDFARCFKGGCGTHEVCLINPCTCQPCVVRFCLPDCPRRVTCHRHEVVFHYGLLKKVRIHFDCHGASVTSFCH